jgi:hypothetical protein
MKIRKLKKDKSGIAGMTKTAQTHHLIGRPGMTGKREYTPKKMPTDKRFVTQDDLNKWGTI